MSFTRLFLYITLAILAFWVLGLLLKLATWAIDIIIVVGGIVIIMSYINEHYEKKKSK